MKLSSSVFSTPSILLVLTLASGLWLSSVGKPLNAAIFTIHKLIALAAVVVTVIQVINTLKGAQLQALLIGLIGMAVLCVLALFVSGALMSAGQLDYAAMLVIHRIAPIVLVFSFSLLVYLLIGN